MEVLGQLAGNFYSSLGNTFPILLFLSTCDILTGLLAAAVEKRLSSKASWAGMSRKAIMFLIVMMANAIEPAVGNIEISNAIAAFYCLTEGLSILENAGRAGVPFPASLRDMLQTLNKVNTMQYPKDPNSAEKQ